MQNEILKDSTEQVEFAPEKKSANGFTGEEEAVLQLEDRKLQRKLLLKADLVIIPCCALIYFAAYLDRNSLGNARILGLQKDLNLSEHQFFNCIMMFFVGYIVMMFPGNVLMRILTAPRQLGGAVVLFGAFVFACAGAQNYSTVLAMRVLIGGAQAFMQGCLVYATLWYKRNEVASRNSLIYCAATIAGAFSGLIAYGVDENLGSSSMPAWRWFFIIEGAVSIGIGIMVWLLLPHFPDQIKNGKHWLFTPSEVALAVERAATYNTQKAGVNLVQLKATFSDPKTWGFGFLNAGTAMTIAAIGNFLPTLIHEFGYSPEQTQLFSVIPYACACVALPLFCIASDHFNRKGMFIILANTISMVGIVLLLTVTDKSAKIAATCLMAMGAYPSAVLLVAWLSINSCGWTKRASTWVLGEILGQAMSICGAYIFDGPPRFTKGLSVTLGMLAASTLTGAALMVWMTHLNAKKKREIAACESAGEAHPHAERTLEEETDLHVYFKYII